MQSRYVISFIGDDRPGLVEDVASIVSTHGGNWLESRLSQLSSKFAGIVLISLPDGHTAQLEHTLRNLDRRGLSVRLTPADAAETTNYDTGVYLSIVGPDRPGIVREVSSALHGCGVNVIEMTTSVQSAPMAGEQLFEATVSGMLSDNGNREELADNLDQIANEMTLDIDINDASR